MEAFSGIYLEATLGGFARILALMTGIEVFANLVAAYVGSPRVLSRKAFGSLVIVMGTTGGTMLLVGPAIFSMADIERVEASVFTQTMDALLPAPLAHAGTLVGVAVLLSASATAALGIQNLARGLSHRHYLPERFGRRGRFGVAPAPVWYTAAVAGACFVLFGTHEATYLGLYAAGVFVLLSMTCWVTMRRLVRERSWASAVGAVVAATFTSTATAIIFTERFADGVWAYLLLVPLFYVGMSAARARGAERRRGMPRTLPRLLMPGIGATRARGRGLNCFPPGKTALVVQDFRRRHRAASPAAALRRSTQRKPGVALPFETLGDACGDGSAVGQQEPGVPHDCQVLVRRSHAHGAVACDTEKARPRDDHAANGTRPLTNGAEAF